MDRPGEKLKRVREKLKLTFRDVEQASRQIAARRGSEEFIIALSRLADIENKGTAPSIFRIYTLCAIYRLDYEAVLRWYGVPRDELESESLQVQLRETHATQFSENTQITGPQPSDLEIDPNKTTFLSHVIRRWGKFPLNCLNGLDLRRYRYGFIGLEDWSMYPILQPGASWPSTRVAGRSPRVDGRMKWIGPSIFWNIGTGIPADGVLFWRAASWFYRIRPHKENLKYSSCKRGSM